MQCINELAEPFKLSKGTARLLAALNERIAAHNLDAEQLRTEVEALGCAELVDVVDPKFADRTEALRRKALIVLGQELRLRSDMREYFAARESDLTKAQMFARERHEKAMADLKAKLVEIGYVDGPIPDTNTPSLIPMFFQRHPAVHEAFVEARRVSGIGSDAKNLNEQRIERIAAELAKLRDNATRLAAV